MTEEFAWRPCAMCRKPWRPHGEQVFVNARWFCSAWCFLAYRRYIDSLERRIAPVPGD